MQPARSGDPLTTSHLAFRNGSQAQSKPINIDFPKRELKHTSLSAGGEVSGGYFSNHENTLVQCKTHSFSTRSELEYPASPSATSNSSPASPSPSTSGSILYRAIPNPDILTPYVGKYHPSKYNPISPTIAPPPTDQSSPSPTHLEIPLAGKRPANERGTSDLKRRLQQYQQDRVTEARLSSPPGASAHGESARIVKLPSPKLQPLDSPGWITPFEMEESAGCMVAGKYGSHEEKDDPENGRAGKEHDGMKWK
ncbi:hypothetical protein VF21_04482 [Pseudogymnoascus sp. 05NY08]|nr:hypothetical protein VF21_04482 [Pseudogymnoascus sp. 05NY08]